MNNKITYTRVGDYNVPNLVLEESKYSNYHLGKYGRMRFNYLKNNKKAEYTILFMENKLDEHLYNTDIECKKQYDFLMLQFMKKENITEELKATNQMEWVQKMNNIKNRVGLCQVKCVIFFEILKFFIIDGKIFMPSVIFSFVKKCVFL